MTGHWDFFWGLSLYLQRFCDMFFRILQVPYVLAFVCVQSGTAMYCMCQLWPTRVASFYVHDVVERRFGFLLELGFISAEFR